MSFKLNRLAFAVAGALFAGQSYAAISQDVGAARNVAVQTISNVLDNQPTTTDVIFTTTAALSSTSTITLTVNGGATFNPSTPPTITGSGTFVFASNTGTLSNNNTRAQWTVTTAGTSGDTLTFNLNSVQSTSLVGVNEGSEVYYTILLNQGGSAVQGTPEDTDVAFNLVNAFELDDATEAGSYVLGVEYGYTRFYDNDLTETIGNFEIANPSDQDVATSNIQCYLMGDFSGIDAVTDNASNFDINIADEVDGVLPFSPLATLTGQTTVDFEPTYTLDGTTVQSARNFTVSCDLVEGGTFNGEADRISETLISTFDRDGFNFRTMFVGTSADNTLIIRDQSGTLPDAGGAIHVTLTTFDSNGSPTAYDSVVLSETLPSGGQVTLTPAAIVAEIESALSVSIDDGLYASFEFAVETSLGDAGNKKQVSGVGIDIQNITNHNKYGEDISVWGDDQL